jgi:hypothetical protein
MKQTTQRFILLALIALLALFAGCKGESPTAPPPITGTSGNGSGTTGGQPPVGATIALAVTTASPFTGSISTITATVTQNNAPVPNGTAVEFATTTPNAHFTDTADNPTTLIRTTTSGVAKATVTSSVAGPVVVTVTVNNVTKSVTLNFQDPVITPPPTSTTPTITSISPATGLPTGNQTVIITGTNFRVPVRVLFDPANGQTPKEGFVTNVTPTQLTVVTPAFDLGVAQQLVANITVIVEAGTPTEQRVTKSAAFTITAPVLTPVVRALNPTSGPIDGGTRVTITGDAFEAPVQVFFGSAQAQVLNVQFHTIDVITPTARDTNPSGSGTVTGPVEVRVLNVNSGKSGSAAAAFRYTAKMQITAISPTFGSALGGTDIVIDGIGFTSPVTVDVGPAGAPIRASVLSVSGTQILARTGPTGNPCGGAIGPVVVTNVDNGDSDISKSSFSYIGVPAVITSVTFPGATSSAPDPTVSSALTVNVQNPGVGLLGSAAVAFTVGDRAANATPQTINTGTGTQPFTVIVPSGLTFPTIACTVGSIAGTKLGPASFAVTFTNATTGCTATKANAITITPEDTATHPNTCVLPPPPAANVTTPASGCANAGSIVAAGGATGTATITISNSGGQPLTINASPSISGANAGDFSISPLTAKTVAPGGATTYTITFDPSAAGSRNATVTFTTNDPANPTVPVCLTGTGT